MSSTDEHAEMAWRAALALSLVETAFRNSRLEDLHAGVFPTSAVGDYSDVKVVTPYGEIAWADVSRFCDEEMKALMIETVNRVYTVLTHPEPFSKLAGAARWNAPELDPAMMDAVARWQAREQGVPEAEIWKTWPIDEAKRAPPLRVEQRRRAGPAAPKPDPGTSSIEATPEFLRLLAQAPETDADWTAKARRALRLAAVELESAHLAVLDEIEASAFGRD